MFPQDAFGQPASQPFGPGNNSNAEVKMAFMHQVKPGVYKVVNPESQGEKLLWIINEVNLINQQLAHLINELRMSQGFGAIPGYTLETISPIITINHLISHRSHLLDLAQKIRLKVLEVSLEPPPVIFEPVAETVPKSKTDPLPTPEENKTTFSKECPEKMVKQEQKSKSDSRVIHGRFQDSLSPTELNSAAKKVEEIKAQKSANTAPKTPALDSGSAISAMDAILSKCCGSDKSPKKPQLAVTDTDGGVVANINVKEAPKSKRPYKRRVMPATE